ncbi:uncharacterized protein LOC127590382 [Hippocampus zosterae]|uniref:uncharacterized protein LOC127590382 n=1 Tax=Hippocampus zosterae TaxID=109293 RepID=UPI00223D25A8|nr:uncharacterized protein LOC127590382 [Hippocampus zosterae]XP_051905860.1 uncharacterized protein LOC127590382 [Hippocampus zosterae]
MMRSSTIPHAAVSVNNYADCRRFRPVRPPLPEPPMGIYVDAIHPKMVVNECNRASITEAPTKPAAMYEREPPRPPPPRPPLPNNRQISVQQKSERGQGSLPRQDNIISLPCADEPLYMEIEEALYLEILPGNDVTFQAQETSRPQIGMQSQRDFKFNSSQYSNAQKQDIQELLEWMRTVSKASRLTPSLHELSKEEEIRVFNQRALNTKQALCLFHLLMTQRSQRLQGYILDFNSISDLLDKETKTTKTMGIAGGTTGAVGGVAAMVGIALAPATMGASLVVTAVGVGMVGVAGGMGVHASKPNKKIGDGSMIKKLVYDYKLHVADIEQCLDFVLCELTEVQRHDLVRLQQAGVPPDALTIADEMQSLLNNIKNDRNALYTRGMSSDRLLHVFAAEVDRYFKEKNGQKRLKKSAKGRLSERIQLLARNLEKELDYLNFVWKLMRHMFNNQKNTL